MVDTFIVLRVVIRRISSSRSERRQRLLVLRLAGQVPCSFGWCRQGTRGATLSLAALAFAVLAACGGDAKGPVSGPAVQTSSAPTLAASDALPSVPGYARPPATGIADLDVIVAVLSNRSLATTSYLLDLQYLECRSFQTGVLVPACPRGVAPGTTVPMLPLEACAEGYANADTLDAYLRGTTPEGSRVYAVFKVAPSSDAGGQSEFRIVVATPRGLVPGGNVVSVVNGKVTKIAFPCAPASPAELVAAVASERFVISPPR